MNVVCRLMCYEELQDVLQGKDVVKGNKGEKIYHDLVGDSLSFSPIKYCDMISNGDLAVILQNMKNFFITHSVPEAWKRLSNVYMLVLEDDGQTDFTPHFGTLYRKRDAESSKELLTNSYSTKHLKPLRLYEIDVPKEMVEDSWEKHEFQTERTPVEGYNLKMGFPIQVQSYEEAVNDMFHALFSEEQIQQIYDKIEDLDHLEYLNEDIREREDRDIEIGEDAYEFHEEFYKEFYDGNPRDWKSEFKARKSQYMMMGSLNARQTMKDSVKKEEIISGKSTGVRGELERLSRQAQLGKESIFLADENMK